MNYLNTAFIRLAFFFVTGILVGFFIEINLSLLFLIFAAGFALFLAAYFRAKKQFLQDIFFGISTFLLLFLTGITTTQIHLPKNQPHHYTNLNSSEKEAPPLLASITEELKPDLYNRKFIAEAEQINGISAHGKILLLLRKDSTANQIEVGNRLILSSRLQPIPAPLNPHQFNYRKFMENRGVLNQVYLSGEDFRKLENSGKTSVNAWANRWRSEITGKLRSSDFNNDELAIIQALLLGQRQDISEEIYNNYAAAGVIHILAVSGLHVGIILLLLHRLLSPLERFKKGRFLKTILLILLLWLFALLAGLSPSVVRAVTMFSFVAIGLQIKRRTNVLNTLFISMVLLLLIRPQFLFEVGFQLSYLAVFSIVLLQPPLYSLLKPQNVVMKYFWGLLTVTVAAQAGVLPLSLFYFHQFPGLFFISNLVILPFMGLLLALGSIVIILALLNLLPNFVTDLYGFLIESLNRFVQMVAQQEDFLFRDIPFSGNQVMAFYLLLAALFLLLKSVSFQRIMIALMAVLVLQIVYYFRSHNNASEEFIVFHKNRNTLIGQKTKDELLMDHNLTEIPNNQNLIRNYVVGENINRLETGELQNIYEVNKELLLVVDSTAIFQLPNLKPEYVLLINSPKINLERLIEQLQPKAIIADGSNYKSSIENWDRTCSQKNIYFHPTGIKGSFTLQK